MKRLFLFLLLPSLLAACSPDETPVAPQDDLPYLFVDATSGSGLDGFRQVNGTDEKLIIVESVGGGVALFDVEGDGDLDAYLTNGGMLEGLAPDEQPADALYLNDGRGNFTDGTAAAGLGDRLWTNGVRVVDLEGDGDNDLYLTNYGPNVLYENQGDGTYADVTERAGVGDPLWSTGAGFLDHDRDGDLDLYVANYIEFDEERILRERPTGTIAHRTSTRAAASSYDNIEVMFGPKGLPPERDRFYVNEGDGRFRDASAAMGIDQTKSFGFQCLAFDADGDGWIDVYVANDVLANLLWKNEEGERFTDIGIRSGLALAMSGKAQGGMGTCVGDYDGDLIPDVFVTNFVDDYSTLYRGRPGGVWIDTTSRAKLNQPTHAMVGWGCEFVDFDSDGDLEVFSINGHVYPQVDLLDLGTSYLQRNQLFELVDGRYLQPEGEGGPAFSLEQAGRGAAVGDVDGDGDLDLLVGNIDDHPALLRNDGPSGNWVKVLALGTGKNRDAVGARLVLTVGDKKHVRFVGSGGSFLSSSDPREHFGLGSATRAEALEVTWPDGRVERITDLEAGRLYTIQDAGEGEAAAVRVGTLEPQ